MTSSCTWLFPLQLVFRLTTKKHQNSILLALCEGKLLGTGRFPSQMASNADSIVPCYDIIMFCQGVCPTNDISIEFQIFNQHLQFSGLKYAQLIMTKFCTCHDSVTVVTCAKFCHDQPNMLWTRVLQRFIEFQIRSKYRQWAGRQDGMLTGPSYMPFLI